MPRRYSVAAGAGGDQIVVARRRVDRLLEDDLAGLLEQLGDPQHPPRAVVELAVVVGDLDPVAGAEAQHLVAPDRRHRHAVGGVAHALDRGRDRGVLARKLETGVALLVADVCSSTR